jgi:predicted transcriptional regulator YdeE
MKFVGVKRTIPVDDDYSQIAKLGQFWDEMRKRFPGEFLYGLGMNWTGDTFDYYLGKINEDWADGSDTVELPEDDWHEYSCADSGEAIEQMYRGIYDQGKLDYEIESMKDGRFMTKVHFLNSKGAKQ